MNEVPPHRCYGRGLADTGKGADTMKATCRWPGCERPRHAKGFCPRDYQRAKREGTYGRPWETWQRLHVPPDHCRWPGCDRTKIEGRGLCKRDWLRAYRLGDFDQPWTRWGNNVCGGCGESFTGRNRQQKHCSDACALEAWKRRRPDRLRELARRHSSRRRALKLAATVESFTEADIRSIYGDDCYLCDQPIDFDLEWPDPRSPTVDHIVPLSKGGTHALDNVAMTHFQCNNRKNAGATKKRPRPLAVQ